VNLERPGSARGATTPPGPDLIEAKLLMPRELRGRVPRTGLLRQLRAARGRPLVTIIAPAGYGKTSVLAQLSSADPRPTAWLTVDDLDDDPATFLTYLAAAIDRVQPLEPTVFSAIASLAVPHRAIVGRLLAALADRPGSVLLVIDDAHHLRNPGCLDILTEFIGYLPRGAQLAMAAREFPALPFDRWRLANLVLDLGPDDLAMDEQETAGLVRQLGISLPTGAIEHLTAHTQGWPALLALATLAAGHSERGAMLATPHASPSASDYLRSEVLGARHEAEVVFMTRTSILGQLNGPVCDALLEQRGSAAYLAGLARSTLLVDDYGGWFRYHPMLRAFLRKELEAREPLTVPELHRRASHWYEAAGDLDLAVDHAFEVGDVDFAAAIVSRALLRYHWSGRRTTLHAWLRRFDDAALERRPWLAVLAAWEELAEGDVRATEHLADIAERGVFEGRPPDGTASLGSGRAMLRAAMGRRGADDMLANATLATELEAEGSRWRDFALWILGLAHLVQGDAGTAETVLADASSAARAVGNDGLAYCVLGHRALLAMNRQDWSAGISLLDQARAIGGDGRFDGYLSGSLARIATVRIAVHRGASRDARRELARMASLRPLLTAAAPSIAILALLELARTHLAVGDPHGARSLLAQAGEVVRERPDLGILPAEVATLRSTVVALPVGVGGASTLTAAELRVLAMLPYYLSFKEIGQRLGVKATTIKTHALSIYGKLGASSRSEAVELAVEAGLLEPFPAVPAVSAIAEDAAASLP
jgi:LuxR family transcriptional regulator, maltose regulon positive regulatory protein